MSSLQQGRTNINFKSFKFGRSAQLLKPLDIPSLSIHFFLNTLYSAVLPTFHALGASEPFSADFELLAKHQFSLPVCSKDKSVTPP